MPWASLGTICSSDHRSGLCVTKGWPLSSQCIYNSNVAVRTPVIDLFLPSRQDWVRRWGFQQLSPKEALQQWQVGILMSFLLRAAAEALAEHSIRIEMLQSAKWYPVCFSPPIGWAAVQGNCLVPEICWQPPALCSSERENGVNSGICICPCCSDRQPDSCSPHPPCWVFHMLHTEQTAGWGAAGDPPEMLGKLVDTSLTAVLGT